MVSLLIRIVLFLAIALLVLWLLLARPSWPVNGSYRPESPAPSPERLRQNVTTLAQVYYPRDQAHPQVLDRAAIFLAKGFRETTDRVSEQTFLVNGTEYRNVVAVYGPEGDAAVVVGAHYDTDGEQPGADDNASGVAALLELGHLLANAELQIQVQLVAYSLEEMPHFRTENMGSFVHAASLKSSGRTVVLMISLEMIGYFDDTPNSQGFPLSLLKLFYPSTGNFITTVGALFGGGQARALKQTIDQYTEVPVFSINAPRFIPGVDFSDHLSYWEHGFPAVMVTDTAFYRNLAYHSKADTPDRLDYQRMAQVVYGVSRYLITLAGR